jgi:hypothetical protein
MLAFAFLWRHPGLAMLLPFVPLINQGIFDLKWEGHFDGNLSVTKFLCLCLIF